MGLGCTRQSTVCITWREVIARLSSTAWSASRTRFAASFIHESFGPQFRCSRVFGISCEENVCEREDDISTPFFLVVERMIPSLFFSFSVFISRYFWNREKKGGTRVCRQFRVAKELGRMEESLSSGIRCLFRPAFRLLMGQNL